MSSHHFVKEQQEPAVFILNPSGINFESVASLLEWSPTLLVDQESVDLVLSWGIKIDVVLATSSYQEENKKGDGLGLENPGYKKSLLQRQSPAH